MISSLYKIDAEKVPVCSDKNDMLNEESDMNTTSRNIAGKNTISKNTTSKNTTSKNEVCKNKAVKNTISKNTTSNMRGNQLLLETIVTARAAGKMKWT